MQPGAIILDQYGNDPRKKEFKILVWRIITVLMILICAVILIYFVAKGVVWVYDRFFGPPATQNSVPASQQQRPAASPFGSNSSQSSDLNPPPMPISFFNVVPLPQSPEAPAVPALLPDNNSNPPVQIPPQNQNPATAPPGSTFNSNPSSH